MPRKKTSSADKPKVSAEKPTVNINKSKIDIASVVGAEVGKSSNAPLPEGAMPPTNLEKYIDKYLDKTATEMNRKQTKQQEIDPTPQYVKKTTDDKSDRQRILTINRILKYQDSKYFSEIVKTHLGMSYTYEYLAKKNSQQLDHILNRIRVACDSNAVDTFYDSLAGSGALVVEKTVSGLGYDIEGFSQNLMNNQQFFVCFERFKIESDLPTIPVGFQLAQVVLGTAVMTHLQNKSRLQQETPEKPTELNVK